MAVNVTIKLNQRGIARLLRSPTGPVARDVRRRAGNVQAAARRNVHSRSGALARSITVEVVVARGSVGARIGSNLSYATFVHEGTGIYGPARRPIRPRRGQVMAFGGTFARQVRGQRPNPFLANALRAAAD